MNWNERLLEHWNDPIFAEYQERCFGMFCQGSQNHGLASEASDLDTIAIIFPTGWEIANLEKPISEELHRANGEHITLIDYRLFLQRLRKMNPSCLEILYTRYYHCNTKFKSSFLKWVFDHRDEIAHANERAFLKSISGMAKTYFNTKNMSKEKKKRNLYHLNWMVSDYFIKSPETIFGNWSWDRAELDSLLSSESVKKIFEHINEDIDIQLKACKEPNEAVMLTIKAVAEIVLVEEVGNGWYNYSQYSYQ